MYKMFMYTFNSKISNLYLIPKLTKKLHLPQDLKWGEKDLTRRDEGVTTYLYLGYGSLCILSYPKI